MLAQARLDHTRFTGLRASNTVSQSDADKAAEALRVAEADLKRSHAAIAEAEALMAVAEKNLLFRQEQLAFTEIHSPYDGLIIRRDRDPGDVLVPGASLMQMISLDELWVSAWVDETAMPALATGQPARIVFRSEPNRSYRGIISRLGRETDRETREFLVRCARYRTAQELDHGTARGSFHRDWTTGRCGPAADCLSRVEGWARWCFRERRWQGAVARGHARFARQGSRRHRAGTERR